MTHCQQSNWQHSLDLTTSLVTALPPSTTQLKSQQWPGCHIWDLLFCSSTISSPRIKRLLLWLATINVPGNIFFSFFNLLINFPYTFFRIEKHWDIFLSPCQLSPEDEIEWRAGGLEVVEVVRSEPWSGSPCSHWHHPSWPLEWRLDTMRGVFSMISSFVTTREKGRFGMRRRLWIWLLPSSKIYTFKSINIFVFH